MAQLHTKPGSLEGLSGPRPWHFLQPLTQTPTPQQYSRLSRSRCRVLLAPAEDGVAACLPHHSSSSASPARLRWHFALPTLPGVPGRAPGPASTETKSSSLSPTQPGLSTPTQPCCPGFSRLLSPLRLPLPLPLGWLAGWLWEEAGVLIMQKGEGRRRRRREAERERER